ncbi:hypothetical protein HY967_01325 [Candidatus Jorgensenbacteria bacterium]|nr:hypothetical protein [Candidatus Jorgensenbacteria bacterium]
MIYELEKKKQLIITRKRDGWKLFAAKSKNQTSFYTDGMNKIDGRLAHLAADLEEGIMLPNSTLFTNEGVIDTKNEDDRGKVISLFKANEVLSLEKQRQFGFLRLIVLNIVFWKNQYHLDDAFEKQLGLMQEFFGANRFRYIEPLQVLNMTFGEAKDLVVAKGWEGLVLYDRNFKSSYRLDGGNPERIKGCYKWKPITEDDFIVREWIPREKDPKMAKEVVLLQIDPTTNEEFECGKLGSFSNNMRRTLADAKYPLVMQVEFEGRYKSGKLINPILGPAEIRTDKKVQDCTAPKSFKTPI